MMQHHLQNTGDQNNRWLLINISEVKTWLKTVYEKHKKSTKKYKRSNIILLADKTLKIKLQIQAQVKENLY